MIKFFLILKHILTIQILSIGHKIDHVKRFQFKYVN